MPEGIAIAIRVPYSPSAELPAIFKKAKEALEKAGQALFLSSEEKKAQAVSEAVVKWAEEEHGKKLPRGEGIEIVVAKTHREAGEEIYKHDAFPNNSFQTRGNAIAEYMEKPEKGTALPKLNKVIIDLQAIEEAHGRDKKAQETCLVATTIHETLHCLGGFEDTYRMQSGKNKYAFDPAWLLEGTTEFLARMLLRDKYPAEEKKFTCGSNNDNVENIRSLARIAGIRTILEAYFEGSFEKIRKKMNAEGVSDEDIVAALRLAHRLAKMDERESKTRRAAIYQELESCLKEMEKIPAQTLEKTLAQWSGKIWKTQAGDETSRPLLIEVKNEKLRSGEIIRLEPDESRLVLSYPALKEKYGEKAEEVAVYNTVLATLYSLGSFGERPDFDLEWLRASYSIHLAESSMETKEREILKEIEKYPAQAIEELVGKEIVLVAFIGKSVSLIIKELEKAGVPKEDIEELFISGSEATHGKSQNRFTLACLKVARKLNPNDAEADASYHGFLFGPLGKEASQRMSELRKEEKSETRRKARETAIQMKLLGSGLNVGQEFSEEWLLENFNDGSEYARNGMMKIMRTYSGAMGWDAVETGDFVSSLAEEFEGEYSVKPTVTQLMDYAAGGIYSQFSYRPEDAMEILGSEHTAEEIERIAKTVEAIPRESSGQRFTFKDGCPLVFSAFPGIEITEKKQKEAARNAILLLNCKCNIAEPTARDVATMIASFMIKAEKERRSSLRRDWINYLGAELNRFDYPIIPGHAQSESAGKARINGKALKPEKMEEVGKTLSIAFPSLVSRIEDKFGMRLYDQNGYLADPIKIREGGHGSIEGFQPYGKKRIEFDPSKPGPNVEKAMASISFRIGFRGYQSNEQDGAEALRATKIMGAITEYSAEGGKIKFDMESFRKNGCLSAEEVLDCGYALCLEHTYLFLALSRASGYSWQALGFKVFADEFGSMVPHVVGGLLLDPHGPECHIFTEESVIKFGEVWQWDRKKPLTERMLSEYEGHHLFELDGKFRDRVFEAAGARNEDLRLFLMDLSWNKISPQYRHIVPMSSLELLSAYFTNAGTYFLGKGENEKALENFGRALRMNPEDEMCRSHLIEYYSKVEPDAKRVLELSEDYGKLVNPRDFLNKALALLCAGREEEAIIAALKSLQVSENHEKARAFLEEVGFIGTKASA